VIIFQKIQIQTGSWFLGLRWLDTALDFSISALSPIESSVKPEHSRHPHGNKTSLATAQLGIGNSRKTSLFLFFAPSRLRVKFLIPKTAVDRLGQSHMLM
jgi:hypothetical protein